MSVEIKSDIHDVWGQMNTHVLEAAVFKELLASDTSKLLNTDLDRLDPPNRRRASLRTVIWPSGKLLCLVVDDRIGTNFKNYVPRISKNLL